MNAAEVCVRADRVEVETAVSKSPLVAAVERERDVLRMEMADRVSATLTDDEQDGYTVSIFVFDRDDTQVAKRLYDWFVENTDWPVEWRDKDTFETVKRRTTVAVEQS